jgi:hypothetical protein
MLHIVLFPQAKSTCTTGLTSFCLEPLPLCGPTCTRALRVQVKALTVLMTTTTEKIKGLEGSVPPESLTYANFLKIKVEAAEIRRLLDLLTQRLVRVVHGRTVTSLYGSTACFIRPVTFPALESICVCSVSDDQRIPLTWLMTVAARIRPSCHWTP